ncbi:MAG: ATP synthase F1 subunit gamma [Planctomycetota bacterium]|jgi:F-type H+-transporting ATPase subunit gamma|nr:ATP synthase F1 subunit gamma [Planctomycetota bacterium]
MQAQDIKRRIRSVKSTQQITRAMKFVAAAKLRRAQERMLSMRPYADAIDGLVKHVAEDLVGDEHPLLSPHPKLERVAYVLIAGDRGLAGGFNTNLFRAVGEYVRSKRGVEPVFFAVGKRTVSWLRKTEFRVVRSYHDVFEKLSYIMAGDVCEKLVEMMSAGGDERIDEAYVVYNEFASMLTQRPVIRRLLPISVGDILPREKSADAPAAGDGETVLEEIVLEEAPDDIFDLSDAEEELMEQQGEMEAGEKAAPVRPVYELLPDARTALDKLMSRRMATELYRGMLESYAAELAARMSAMDNAANNAEEMVSRLTLELNRARQAGITMELLDIIGGSDAIN